MKYLSNNIVVNDFLNHAETLLINNPTKGLIPLQLWEHQVDVVEQLFEHRYICSAVSRQMGMTTLMMTFAHWYASRNDNKTIVYSSHNQTMLNVCREFFRQLDYNVKFKVCNSDKLVMENGTQILFKRMNPWDYCGYAIDLMLVDNAAYIKDVCDGWQALVGQIMADGMIWINSTPNSSGNWFAKIYGGNNMYKKIHLPYYKHYDEQWASIQRAQLSADQFRQEIMAEFL